MSATWVVASKMRGGQGATKTALTITIVEELMSIPEGTAQKTSKLKTKREEGMQEKIRMIKRWEY